MKSSLTAMNFEQARVNMIEQQIRTWDVLNQQVLQTLVAVRREAFVPTAYQSLTFFDTEIPLPGGENMLSPKMEARLLQEAGIGDDESVRRIGLHGSLACPSCATCHHG